MDETPIGRRVFLGLAAFGVSGIVWGSKAADFVERLLGPVAVKDGTGLLGLLPTGRFRIYSVTNTLPRRDPADWRLEVDGLAGAPYVIDYEELLRLPAVELVKDFQCVTGWRVPDVRWKGVRLADVLERAAPRAEAKALEFESFDGAYTETLTLEQARRDDVIVAYELDGKPISSAHGGPVRLYVAPMYGYKSLKWLQRITLVAVPRPGYWEKQGYDVDAWIGRSNGRSDEPV
ncbi:MAG: molybdopterin-dependent oxidoreductase [Actinomycetota bacterium]|jgi:DMSO/TMAO reductase YedYZ molybdopterin-dependent catalytic subunit